MFALGKVLILGALVAAGTPTLPGAAAQPAAPVVTGELQCPGNTFLVTVANTGDQTYNVEARVQAAPPVAATVGPNETVEIPVSLSGPGTSFPFEVHVTGDNGFEETVFEALFDCPLVADIRVTTQEGTPVEKSDVCPAFAFGAPGPRHGTVQVTTDEFEGFIYTPDPGFVGEDSFEYVCLGAANTIGTVFITVTAAPAALPAPPPAATPVAVSAVTFTG